MMGPLEVAKGLISAAYHPFNDWALRDASAGALTLTCTRTRTFGEPGSSDRPSAVPSSATTASGNQGSLELRLHAGGQSVSAEAPNLLHEFVRQMAAPARTEPRNTVELIEKTDSAGAAGRGGDAPMRGLISDTLRRCSTASWLSTQAVR